MAYIFETFCEEQQTRFRGNISPKPRETYHPIGAAAKSTNNPELAITRKNKSMMVSNFGATCGGRPFVR
jgi:hypothetical protein